MSTPKNLRTTLDNDMSKKFEEVKKSLGLSRDAEVVRFLINEYYRKLLENK